MTKTNNNTNNTEANGNIDDNQNKIRRRFILNIIIVNNQIARNPIRK